MRRDNGSRVTWRALLAGALIAAFLGGVAPYENLIISGSPLSFDYSTPAALFLFFIFVIAINPLLALLRRGWRFSQAELVTVYLMAAVACTVPTLGLVCILLPHISAGAYYASPENDWANQVLPFVPQWLRLTDERAVKWFYEGLPQGETLPWDAWLPVLLAWAPMLGAFFGAMTALAVLVRQQWVQHERLTFPLVQVPIALIGEPGQRQVLGPFLRTPAMWVGFGLPVALYSLRALHNYFPFVPEGMAIWQYYYFWNNKFRLRLSLSYAVVGFAYLLSTKMGFSLWTLGLFSSLEHALLLHFGMPGTQRVEGTALGSAYLVYQGFGAMMALVGGSLWVSRHHLLAMGRHMLGASAPSLQEDQEILSYRQAGLLLIGCCGVMALWLTMSGLDWWLAPVLLMVVFALMIGLARIVAEGGLAVTKSPILPNDVLIGAVGAGVLGASNVASLGMTYSWAGDMRTTMFAALMHGLKLAENYVKSHRRRLFWAVLLAAGAATAAAVWVVLLLGYRHGALNLSFWFFGYGAATRPYAFTAYHLNNPLTTTWDFWGVSGLGALVQIVLTVANQRFYWWPIHPLAFPVSAMWTAHHLMPSIFVAWLVKTVVLRYGGVPWYRKTRPFFLGMILGHCAAGGLWIVIDGFTGMTGNYLFFW